MQTAKHEVDSEVGEEYEQECHHAVDVEGKRLLQETYGAGMEHGRIDKHCNQCPHFFRVPTPVSAPTDICPYSPQEDAYSQAEDSRIEQYPADDLQLLVAVFKEESSNAVEHYKCEKAICNHYDCYVHGEQR